MVKKPASAMEPSGHQDVVDRFTVDPKFVDEGSHALKAAPLIQALRHDVAAEEAEVDPFQLEWPGGRP